MKAPTTYSTALEWPRTRVCIQSVGMRLCRRWSCDLGSQPEFWIERYVDRPLSEPRALGVFVTFVGSWSLVGGLWGGMEVVAC